jgi:hypothetical protein
MAQQVHGDAVGGTPKGAPQQLHSAVDFEVYSLEPDENRSRSVGRGFSRRDFVILSCPFCNAGGPACLEAAVSGWTYLRGKIIASQNVLKRTCAVRPPQKGEIFVLLQLYHKPIH